MNAVHDSPCYWPATKAISRTRGLDLEFVTTPGMAQVSTSHFVKFDSVFKPAARLGHHNEGGIDQYRMCEWGIMKRAVEAESQQLRGRKIVARRLDVEVRHRGGEGLQDLRARMLKDKPIAVTPTARLHHAQSSRASSSRSTSSAPAPARC
jgi:hypothetical protein